MNRQSKPITTDRLDKMRQGFDRSVAERRQWRETPLLVIAGWKIWKLDDRNICLARLEADEDDYRYFPNVAAACRDLLHERIAEAEHSGVLGIVNAVRNAEAAIVAAILEARWPSELLDENAPRKGGAR